ncbi:hypothetical protein D3C84_480490 [compost metagenome]
MALFTQLREFAFAQVRGVADPQVHVALIRLGQCAEAAHQEQAVNGAWRVAVPGLVREGAGQALRFGEDWSVRLVIRQTRGRAAGNVAGQQGMIDVEKKWQQRQHCLLARRQPFHGAGQAAVIEFQKARA